MKIIKTILAVSVMAVGAQFSGFSQAYTMSESLAGIGPNIYFSGNNNIESFNWSGGTLSDTAFINPSAYTIEQSGTINLPTTASSISGPVSESMVTSNLMDNFPLPPTFVFTTNTVTGNMTVGMKFSSQTLSFDTGAQPLVWNGSSYNFDGSAELNVSVDISYSLVTGGETYSGADDNLSMYLNLSLGDQLNVSDYPSSISLSPDPDGSVFNFSGTTLADFTAANGFQADIATTPEPASWAILGCALVVAKLLKRRQS